MTNYELYIGGRLVDLSEDEKSILFTRQRSEYTNPTIVKNSFTKTVKIPGTKNNNQIFNDLWKLDRIQWDDAYNPSRREPFILLNCGSLVEKGYVKLNDITWDKNFYNYNITLYGELGNILYNLTYKVDPDTYEQTEMTLGDLPLCSEVSGGFDGFSINKEIIVGAWNRLSNPTSTPSVYDTINFCVSYDGVPSANLFDPKKILVSVGSLDQTTRLGNRNCSVQWKNYVPATTRREYVYDEHGQQTTDYVDVTVDAYEEIKKFQVGQFPALYSSEDGSYGTINTAAGSNGFLTTGDHYGLLEMKGDRTTLETRDFRSYLMRPVFKLSKIFDSINVYMQNELGYTLDLSDPFFSTSEYTSTWVTMSMLYELNPDVESGTYFSKKDLFKTTSNPANYLISFCKIYGIYLDVDYVNNKLILTRLPNFFINKTNDLSLNLGNNVKINPLSFDKASYIFKFADGNGEFEKKYKDDYSVTYGSKVVNTGYRFDSSSKEYIEKNVFKEAIDVLEQSIYFKYPYAISGTNVIPWPGMLNDDAELPTYKLFRIADEYGNVSSEDTTDDEMKLVRLLRVGSANVTLENRGYQYADDIYWTGLRKGVWNDGFPKLQLHGADNKSGDFKDVLIHFNGMVQTKYANSLNEAVNASDYSSHKPEVGKMMFHRQSKTGYEYVHYLISDDNQICKSVVGSNCYYDNPSPYDTSYIYVRDKIPSFTRASFNFDVDTDKFPVVYMQNTIEYNILADNASFTARTNYFKTNVAVGDTSIRKGCYMDVTGKIKNNHRYFLIAQVSTETGSTIYDSGNNHYMCPDLVGSTQIAREDYVGNPGFNNARTVSAIVDSGNSGSSITKFFPMTTYKVGVSWNTYMMCVYDMTELGIDYMDNIDDVKAYLGIDPNRAGYLYNMDDILDFSLSRELFVPYSTYTPGIGIYNKYWRRYIADLYDINTRTLEGYAYIENIDDVFRQFYYYDNSLWCLSKVTDWNPENKYCKANFVKINNKLNYLS